MYRFMKKDEVKFYTDIDDNLLRDFAVMATFTSAVSTVAYSGEDLSASGWPLALNTVAPCQRA